MSPSEIAFLAFGLVIGTAAGAVFIRVVRRRPVPRREIRLTITPNAIPARRAQTLAFGGAVHPGPVAGSPIATAFDQVSAAQRSGSLSTVVAEGSAAHASRTRVPSPPVAIPADAVAVPVGLTSVSAQDRPQADPGTAPRLDADRSVAALAAGIARLESSRAARAPVAPSRPTEQPRTLAPGRDDSFTSAVRPREPVTESRPVLAAGAVAVAVGSAAPIPVAPHATAGSAGGREPAAGQAGPAPETDPCAGPRRIVEERCALADVTREQARRAADTLRDAQRAYDILRERVDHAQAQADPRHVAAEKERLHAEFRAASDRARTPDETEAAARAWLGEINRLNAAVREAVRVVESGGADLRSQLPVLDRLAAEADAARILGENAEAGCRAAREALAGCEEELARARTPAPPPDEEPHPFDKIWPAEEPGMPGPADDESPWGRLAGLPVIVRVLGGDRAAREQVVAALEAGDPEAEAGHDWRMRLSRLVDAINARAIEDGYLDLPDDDPFWRLFDRRECRDIVGALSALGFRFDGMGGFADGRVPAPRDLSLAVGYAGLDRMRIRTWPRDTDLAGLYARATVAADEWLADQAGDLSLGRMVDALGSRATDLADIWNAWGRIRSVLLAP